MGEQAKVSADVGARLREAAERNQEAKVAAVIREALRRGRMPGLLRLASSFFPGDLARGEKLAMLFADFGECVALEAFSEAEKLCALGPGGAVLRDEEGRATTVDPRAPILDVGALREHAERLCEALERWRATLPAGRMPAEIQRAADTLAATIGGEP